MAVINFQPPSAAAGDQAQQLRDVYRYLFRLSEELNVAFADSETTAKEITYRALGGEAETPGGESEPGRMFQSLRALIIKTATDVTSETRKLVSEMTSSYRAQSDYGTYEEYVRRVTEESAKETIDVWESNKMLDVEGSLKYSAYSKSYIMTGIIDETDEGNDVVGIIIGTDLESYTLDKKTYVTSKNLMSRWTADTLSFWENGTKLAEYGLREFFVQKGYIGEVTANLVNSEELKTKIANIADAQIDAATIKSAQIKDLDTKIATIAEAKIDAAEIDSAQIKDLDTEIATIADARISEATIKSAQIESLNGNKIQAGTVTADQIAAGTITAGKIDIDTLFAAAAFIDGLETYLLKADTIVALEGELDVWASDKIKLAVDGVYVGGTQLLTDTRELTTGTGADKWRLAGAGASTYTQSGTDFRRIKLVSSGATENTWTGASSPVLKLPSGWQGKQITLSAWIYSADWAAVDQGMTWVMCLNNDGSTSRMTYRSKYNMVKYGEVGLGSDATSETKLINYRWTRVSTTFTLTADYFTGGTQAEADFSGNTHAYVQFFLARNGDVRLYAPKLEMGNKATDWSPSPDDPVDKLKTSYIEIMEDHIDIGTGGSLNINAGDFNVRTGDFTMSLTEGDNAEVVMDIGDDGVTDFKGIRAGNVREAVYNQVDMSGAGGLKGLVNKLARTDARRVTYTATADESGEVMLDKFCGSLTIKGAGFKLPRITLGRAFTGTLNVENAILTQSGTAYAFHAGNGTAVLYNCWFAPGTTHGVLAEYTASVRWYNAQAVADLTPMTLTYLFYPRYCGEITYTGKIPGGTINAVSGFVQESSGTTTTVVSGTSTAPTPTTATVSLTATLGYYGTLSGWVSGSCYQGYTTGRGELYGCLKFDVSSLSGKTVQSAKLTLHRKSGVGRNRDAAVYVYGTTTEWGSSAKPALGTKWGESAALMAWDEDGALTIDKTGVQRLVNGSDKQFLLHTGETSGYDGKVYSQHYAQFDSAVLEVTYTT